MRVFLGTWMTLSVLIAGALCLAGFEVAAAGGSGPERARQPAGGGQLAQPRSGPPAVVDVNRPRSPFDCSLPIGISWYGSTERCLEYLCGGKNVYNEYIFDQDNRRRKNPCYGQSPTDFGEHFGE